MIRLPPGSTRTATLFPYTTRVRSITYLLHCLPGPSSRKAVAFANLKPLLNDGARVFGATILGRGVRHNALGRQVLRLYNARGIFGNAEDDLAGLRSEEHTSELQSLMRISYAVFCLKKKKHT